VCLLLLFLLWFWRNESKNRKQNKNGSANFPAHFCACFSLAAWQKKREGGGRGKRGTGREERGW